MKTWFFAIVMAALASGASAQGQIKASDPEGLMSFLQLEGIEGKLGKDDYGDPNIRIRYYETSFSIYFYGCTDGRDCMSIQFYSGYRTGGSWPMEQANLWNKERRFVKAYVSDEGNARIEMDVLTGFDGMSEDDFSEVFSVWTRNVSEFEDVIGW